jgi:hypothetical protein
VKRDREETILEITKHVKALGQIKCPADTLRNLWNKLDWRDLCLKPF